MNKVKDFLFGYLWENPLLLSEMVSGILPFITALFCIKYLKKNESLLLVYASAILFLEFTAFFTSAFSQNNHLIYLIFYFIEILIVAIYSYNATKVFGFKNYYIIITLLALLPITINIIWSNDAMDKNLLTVVSLAPIAFALLSYYAILKEMKIQSLKNSVIFWFSTANMIYFSGRFFVFLFLNQILSEKDISIRYLWQIVSLLLITQRLLFCKAIWQTRILKPN